MDIILTRFAGFKPAFETISVMPEISEIGWDASTKAFLHQCIDSCAQCHLGCGHTSGPIRLPTRLLYLGVADDRFRLIDTQASMDIRYTALSYCWGPYKSLKTITSNIDEMKAGVQVSKLPKSLRDAIEITLEVGIQYIWIDALCILQDSLEDWEKESSNMASIYENAYLTIAAASSSTSRKGFLHNKRKPSATFSMPLPDGDGGSTLINGRFVPNSGMHSHPTQVTVDPWAQRGWTFQEEKLSRRTVLFSTAEVQWMCRVGTTCECQSTDSFDNRPFSRTLDNMSCKEEAFLLWQKHILPDYTNRSLTSQQDALPALSGIIKVLSQATMSQYVAGLWRDNLLLDLLWHRNPGLREFENPSAAGIKQGEGEAPSFSWASITGQVLYAWLDFCNGSDDFKKWSFATTVKSAKAEVIGHNPYGRVRNSSLSLRGPLVTGQLYGRPDDFTGEQITYTFRIGEFDLDVYDDFWIDLFEYEEDGKKMRSPRRRATHLEFPPRRHSARLRPDLLNTKFGNFGNISEMFRGQNPGAQEEADDGVSTFDSVKAWALYIGCYRIPGEDTDRSQSGDDVSEESSPDGILQFFLLLGRAPDNPSVFSRIGLIEVQHKSPDEMLLFGDGLTQTITIV